MNNLALCGAFTIPEAATTSPKNAETIFTFQLSPGGSTRGSISAAIESGIHSVESEKSRRRKERNSERVKASKKRRDRGEYRNVPKALFDAATESESIATDPLLGKVVVGKTSSGESRLRKSGSKERRTNHRQQHPNEQVKELHNKQEVQQPEERDENDTEDIPDKRQLLWHAAMQYHRSRHGKQSNGKSKKGRSRKKQLQEMNGLVNCSSNESRNAHIRKRGLENIHQYLPSLSESLENSNRYNQQRHPEDVQPRDPQNDENDEEYCPICSCRLTILYTSPTTNRLTEIHSGCDSPSSKYDLELPPYCIGCRAYLIFERWDDNKRRRVLNNFEKRLEMILYDGESYRGDSFPLEDFRNGRLIVVGSVGGGMEECITPRISNSFSSEVSSFSKDSYEVNIEEEFTCPHPDRIKEDGVLTAGRSYRRKGRMTFDSCEEISAVSEVEKRDTADVSGTCEEEVAAAKENNALQDTGSEEDPLVDLKTPKDRGHTTANEGFDFGPEHTPGEDSNATLTHPDTGAKASSRESKDPKQTPHPSRQDLPSFQAIDETMTFKSPTLAAKQSLQAAQVAIASTFSEEFAVFQNYNIKKAAATKQIAKCLHRGYELTTVKCDRCEMPMMKRGEEEVCVACPAIMKQVKKIVKEKRYGLKTPKTSNRKDFDDFERVDTRDDEGDLEDVEREHLDLDRDTTCAQAERLEKSVVAPDENMDRMEEGVVRQNHTVPFGSSDYLLVHSASQASNGYCAGSTGSMYPESSLTGPRYVHHGQWASYGGSYQQQQPLYDGCMHNYGSSSAVQRPAHQQNTHPQSSYYLQQKHGHTREDFPSGRTQYPSSNPSQHQIHQQSSCDQFQDQHAQYQSSYKQNSSGNNMHSQNIQHQPFCQSTESGQESFHKIQNGESIESITKCPRDLPPGGLIWDFNPSHEHPINGIAIHPINDCPNEKTPVHEGSTSTNIIATSTVSGTAHSKQSLSTIEMNRLDYNSQKSNGSVHSGLGYANESAPPATFSPRHGKFRKIWDEHVPVSFELNSDAKRQNETSDAGRLHDQQLSHDSMVRAEIPDEAVVCEHMSSPSIVTTMQYLSAEEEKFCERLKQIAISLKNTAEDYKLDHKDGDQQHCGISRSVGQSFQADDKQSSFSSLVLNHEKQSKESSSPATLRKPLEPAGIKSDKRHDSSHSGIDVRENRQCDGESIDLKQWSKADPPGCELDDNYHFRRCNKSPINTICSHQSKEPSTPKRSITDPPENNISTSERYKHVSKSSESVILPIATPKQRNSLSRSPTSQMITPLRNDTNISSKSSVTTPRTKLSHLHAPNSKTSPISNHKHCTTSSNESALQRKSSTASAFHLNIPSWVEDEIDTPIKAVNSFGETSMDQLMRKIDEIENDFSTIVASLPGSDGLSLKFTNSDDDNSTLASKATFDMQDEAEKIEYQLKSSSFESQKSHDKLMSGILEHLRVVQDQIHRLDSSESDDGSEKSQESQGMAELLGRLAHAAESIRSLQVE